MSSATTFDEFWAVKLGDLVQAITEIPDEDVIIAVRGDIGRCVCKVPGAPPVIEWERTRRRMSCFPGEEFEVLAEEGFASSREKTPDVTRRGYLHRKRLNLVVSNPTPDPTKKKE